jgi:hypothetical protein
LNNFFGLFMPIATTWKMYYNGIATGPSLVADGGEESDERVMQPDTWKQIKSEAGHA